MLDHGAQQLGSHLEDRPVEEVAGRGSQFGSRADGSACTGRPGGVPGCGVGQLGELLADPRRCRAAVGRARLERAADGEHSAYVGCQPLVDRSQLGVVDLPQLDVVLVAPADRPAAHLMGVAERHARPHQGLRDVGGKGVPGGGRGGEPVVAVDSVDTMPAIAGSAGSSCSTESNRGSLCPPVDLSCGNVR